MFIICHHSIILNRNAIFYGLPVVTTENYKNFQFSTDYGKLEFFYGNFLIRYQSNVAKKALNKRMISDGIEFPRSIVF